MAAVIDATPSGPNSNSYCEIADADAYHDTIRPDDAAIWYGLGDDEKTRYLIQATRIIETSYRFIGIRTIMSSPQQKLEWPRRLVHKDGIYVTSDSYQDESLQYAPYYLDFNTVPDFVIWATSELARVLSIKNTLADEDKINVQTIRQADGSQVNFRVTKDLALGPMGAIPTNVDQWLRKYGEYIPSINSPTKVANVTRAWRS